MAMNMKLSATNGSSDRPIAEHEAKMISRSHARGPCGGKGTRPGSCWRPRQNLAPLIWRQSSKTYELPVQIRCVQSRRN
jgi:hypothetical protein